MGATFVLAVAIRFAPALLPDGAATAGQEPDKADKGPNLDELVSRLRDTDSAVRFRALSYVGAMKPYPKEIAPHVIRLLKDPNHNVRANAAEALGNLRNALPDLGARFPESVPRLIALLSDRDPGDKHQSVRRSAAYALGHLGVPAKAAVPTLLKLAADKGEDASVRTEAVRALGGIGHASPEVMAALTSLLGDRARINENYPTVGSTAKASLRRLEKRAME